MDTTALKSLQRFKTPESWFSAVDARHAAALFAASSDVSLIIDGKGVIQDIALGNEDYYPLDLETWVGKSLHDIVNIDSRSKAAALLRDATFDARTRWREVNVVIPSGSSIPLNFTAVRLSAGGDVVLFGRDLATEARLQQRVIDIQREMEADYARLRNAESRYRLLFHMASEPVLVIDAENGRITEANPAAARFLGVAPSRLVDKSVRDLFEPTSASGLQSAMTIARSMGKLQDQSLRLADSGREIIMAVSQYRQDNRQFLLMRLSVTNAPEGETDFPSTALEVLKRLPDAFVAFKLDGEILEANNAFVELCQLASADLARGAHLERWLGRPGIDYSLIATNLRDYGSLRDFATLIRGELGAREEVDVTAVYVQDVDEPCVGMLIRPVRRRSALPLVREAGVQSTVENLSHLIGTMPLKDLVRETTDMIEQMCIEAALKLTDDNRASAAQILGLSRQSLYAKLHRFGLGDLSSQD